MKHGILTAALMLALCIVTGPASAKTACAAVLAKIEAKLASKGVTKFTLLIEIGRASCRERVWR